jgi:hypothetical protein
MLLPCLLSKHRVSYNLLDIGIILLSDQVMCLFCFVVYLFVCLLVGWVVCRHVNVDCTYILLNLHGLCDFRQSELQTPETLLPEPTCGVEFAIARSKI